MAVSNYSITLYDNYDGAFIKVSGISGTTSTVPNEAPSTGGPGLSLGVGDIFQFGSYSKASTTISDLDDGLDTVAAGQGGSNTFDEGENATSIESSVFGQPAGTNINGGYEITFLDPVSGLTYNMVTVSWGVNNDDGGYSQTDAFMFYGPNGEPPTGVNLVVTAVDNYVDVLWTEITCFTRGTMIRTDKGQVPIEALRTGDLVLTKDHGLQPIRWIGERRLSGLQLASRPNLRPIRIRAGALGGNLPTHDLFVSPQHRILVKSRIAQRMFSTNEVLIAAKKLTDIEGIDVVSDCGQVNYIHILFDRHEVVFSNGAGTESMYTGPQALKSVSTEGLAELLELFPELASPDNQMPAARVIPPGRLARKLAQRHLKNKVDLFG